MDRLAATVAALALLWSADSSGVIRPAASHELTSFPSLQGANQSQAKPSSNPDTDSDQPGDGASSTKSQASSGHPTKGKPGTLQPESRLALVRFVDGELVRVVTAIPAGKKGFHVKAGAPLDERQLRMAVASAGSAINPGDRAQITNLDFRDKEIAVDINGGGKGKQRLRDRIHLEVGGVPTMTTAPENPVNTNAGATIYLDFDKPLPDMTPDELEQYLAGILDFSKKHSAAVQWIDTLPPEIQQAIQDKKPIVGMDHEMVLAAMGRPDRKVREKTPEGSEIEDWIYGTPPEKTIFVSFEGDKVTQVHQYPQ